MTQISKHTQGPWFVRINEPVLNDGYVSVESESGVLIMSNNLYTSNRDLFVANARLIASAPELLEALTDALKDYDAWLEGTDVTPNE